MRKILFSLGLLALFINVNCSEPEIEEVQISGHRFIKITEELMIYFLEQDFEEWKQKMKDLGFEEMSDYEGIAIYYAGRIGAKTQLISKNQQGVVSVDWYDTKSKKPFLNNLQESLEAYFDHTSEGTKYYAKGNYVFGYDIKEELLLERILIRRK